MGNHVGVCQKTVGGWPSIRGPEPSVYIEPQDGIYGKEGSL